MRHRLLSFLIALSLIACGGSSTEPRPRWLLELIARLEAEPVANPPAFIELREYGAGVYYYLPPRCCDIWSDLYDEMGTIVCHPDGGITGDGDGRCPNLEDPIRAEIVWRDVRGGP